MGSVTIKLEGITSFSQMSTETKRDVVIAGGSVIKQHCTKIQNMTRSKINNITGETGATIKTKVEDGKNYSVGKIGTIDATKEEAIRFNSLEYGHAAPGKGKDSGISKPVKVVAPRPTLRPSIDEDKSSFKKDMESNIKTVVERR